MKKQFLLFLLALLPVVASAQDAVEIDGIYYNVIKKAKVAEVTKNPSGKYTGSVDIPASVIYEGVEYSVTSIGDRAFNGCYGLTSVTIPNSVTSIGDRAFNGCYGLTAVTIPNSVTSIGDWAFWDCDMLTSVHISDVAAWCKISFGGSNSNPLYYAHHLYLGENEITDLVIPNSVTSIGGSAFEGCSGLTSVTIPNSVTSIGGSAFFACSGLTSVTIPKSVTSIGDAAFAGCSGLTAVTIPNSVTAIGAYAFSGCSGLTSVTIPNCVTSIGGCAFSDCSGLTSVTIPNSVTSIGSGAFSDCSGLTSVTIPNSVTSIGNNAFRDCSGLTSVTIGSGVERIYSQAFASCKDLMDVYCLAEKVPSTKTDAFQDSYIEYVTLHVPAASISDYKAVEPWKNFKSIVSLNGEDIPEEPEVKKCSTPTIALVDGKLVFSCETEGVEYVSEVKVGDAKKNYTSTVSLTGVYTVSVYAMKTGWENSDVATMEFTLGAGGEVCDTNKDGTVDVADIATIISKMAGH